MKKELFGELKVIAMKGCEKFASQVEAIENQKALLREQLADAEQLMAERMQYYFS